jgi:hypothetical protein
MTKKDEDGEDEKDTKAEETLQSSDEKWEQLLAEPEAKCVMRDMTREALEDYRAGRTTDITITEDGQLAPYMQLLSFFHKDVGKSLKSFSMLRLA